MWFMVFIILKTKNHRPMTSQNIVSNSENDEWQLINTHQIKII
jgi:hypothetical protein